MSKITISQVCFKGGLEKDLDHGLIGWISCTLNDQFRVDGLSLRLSKADHYYISFPCRRDGSGKRRFFIFPISNEARRDMEKQILDALRIPKLSSSLASSSYKSSQQTRQQSNFGVFNRD